MDTLEQLRIKWQQLKIENEVLSQENRRLTNQLAAHRITTHQQKLSSSYKLGYAGIFLFPFLALLLLKLLNCSISLAIAYASYGLLIGVAQLWFSKFVSNADYMSLPSIDAVKHAKRVVKYQRNMTICSIVGALAIIIPLFCELHNSGVLLGGIVGGIAGGAVGAKRCIYNFRHANAMLSEAISI